VRNWGRRVLPAAVIAGTGLFALFCLSAWFQVQAVRLSYRARSIQRDVDALSRRERAARRRLEAALALSRLDDRARRRGLAVPQPEQVRLLSDRR
jgi:hypothetical protein